MTTLMYEEDSRERGLSMEKSDREVILAVTAHAPALFFQLGLQYLRLKRSANKARSHFLNELVNGGVPLDRARILADQYASVTSFRNVMGMMKTWQGWSSLMKPGALESQMQQ
jgi:hypothetical protein